jgi:hypothetical protein
VIIYSGDLHYGDGTVLNMVLTMHCAMAVTIAQTYMDRGKENSGERILTDCATANESR